jgi:hypothetical protein
VGTAFATCAVANPRFAAAFIGTLIKGLGPDHVIWGTDSLWYGSPQWQIEAMRRLEIPEDMQKKHGFKPLGPADGPVKRAIFAGNSAPLRPAAQARPARPHHRQDRGDQGGVHRGRRGPHQRPRRLCGQGGA